MNFNFITSFGVAAAIVTAAPVQAATVQPFNVKAFEAAQAQDRPILVDVYADWCPVCRAQHVVLSQLLPTVEFKKLTVFKVNFDAQKDVWTKFGVNHQSTLIAFHGRKEVGRAVAVTDTGSIAKLLKSSLR